jgi:DNA (cytosine-5)-methyltransferase 1
MKQFSSLELCAGAGGQAIGLECAGFEHRLLVEIDKHACSTLRLNRPSWEIFEGDLRQFDPTRLRGEIDLLAGGVPCPPFSTAGKQLGHEDERDLFPEAIRIASIIKPQAIMLENVRGLLDKKFDFYRELITRQFRDIGYEGQWRLLNASDFGVSQLRPRVVFVAFQGNNIQYFKWPSPSLERPCSVGEKIGDLMALNGWELVDDWKLLANDIAPTIVGGSKKHGGADLGPTRAKRMWAKLGVDGMGIADAPPSQGFEGMPRLTVHMVARLQGFPNDWKFAGGKTAQYRQIGNAFPAPVARAVGLEIKQALTLITSKVTAKRQTSKASEQVINL